MVKKLDVGKDVWKHLPVKMKDLPKQFQFGTRSPSEQTADYNDMLAEMGYCPVCKDLGVRYNGVCVFGCS